MARKRKKPGLFYSDHARDGMERRKITESDVEAAVASVDTTYPGTDKKRENLVKEGVAADGRRLCVVVKKARQHIVVSAYWKPV